MQLSSLTVVPPAEIKLSVPTSVDVQAACDRCSRGLYRYFAVRAGGDAHLADDLMQQLWLQVSRSRASIPRDEVDYWLIGIARNLIRAHWRKKKRRPEHVPIADPHLAAELSRRLVTETLPLRILEKREVRDQLLLALTELRSAEQELIVGHYFRGRSQAALAEELGVSERAVEGRLYRARRSLRDKLQHLET